MSDVRSAGEFSRLSGPNNLSLLLRLIHERRNITRSEICQISGLTRSTVAKLVTTACSLGLATEIEASSIDKVGRPSLGVEASSDVIALAVHPEVDYLEVKAVAFNGEIVTGTRILYSTPCSPEQSVVDMSRLIAQVCKDVARLDKGYRIVGAGVIIPGQVQSESGIVRQAPHLQWREVRIREMLRQQVELPIFIGNDASLGCKAEITYGAAKGSTEVVYLHGSSGIGGGVYTGGSELKGSTGYAAEIGHIRISNVTDPDYSGIPGTLEALVRREDIEEVLGLNQVADEELESALLNNRTPKSTALLKKQITALAIGTANLVNIFNPEVIVLAGFLRSVYRFDQKLFHDELRRHAIPAALESLSIFTDELGSNSLAIGASELVFEELIQDPNRFLKQPESAR